MSLGAMLPGDHMVKLKAQGIRRLRNVAVLTCVSRSSPDGRFDWPFHA
jgi:hypothetical protein